MTPKTAFECEGDPRKLRDLVQTDLKPRFDEHRPVIRAYEINENVDCAFSIAEANHCHGNGGAEQYYIADFNSMIEEGAISRREELDLWFDPSMLQIPEDEQKRDEKYTNDQLKSEIYVENLEGYMLPSENTHPSLEGAYTGETIGLDDDLIDKVSETNEIWHDMNARQQNEYYVQNAVVKTK